jgi:hypothetical protein
MPERLNGAVLKTAGAAKPPGVRIPLPPPAPVGDKGFRRGWVVVRTNGLGSPPSARRASRRLSLQLYSPIAETLSKCASLAFAMRTGSQMRILAAAGRREALRCGFSETRYNVAVHIEGRRNSGVS